MLALLSLGCATYVSNIRLEPSPEAEALTKNERAIALDIASRSAARFGYRFASGSDYPVSVGEDTELLAEYSNEDPLRNVYLYLWLHSDVAELEFTVIDHDNGALSEDVRALLDSLRAQTAAKLPQLVQSEQVHVVRSLPP
jgi:hypothetical protein